MHKIPRFGAFLSQNPLGKMKGNRKVMENNQNRNQNQQNNNQQNNQKNSNQQNKNQSKNDCK